MHFLDVAPIPCGRPIAGDKPPCYDFTLKFLYIELGCLWQRLLSSLSGKRGWGCVSENLHTPYPLFLEGNQKRLEFLYV